MMWLYELVATLFASLTPQLHKFGIPNLHFPDAILMFVLIPFVNLMNDEDIKGIISEESWYQGLRYMLGIYVEPTAQDNESRANIFGAKSVKRIPSKQLLSTSLIRNSKCHKKRLLNRCDSYPISLYARESGEMVKQYSFRRRKSHLAFTLIEPPTFNKCKDQHQ